MSIRDLIHLIIVDYLRKNGVDYDYLDIDDYLYHSINIQINDRYISLKTDSFVVITRLKNRAKHFSYPEISSPTFIPEEFCKDILTNKFNEIRYDVRSDEQLAWMNKL